MRHVNRLSQVGIVGAATLVLAAGLAAHDLYIKMESYWLPEGTPVRIPILNGTFQGSENSITLDRVDDVSLVHRQARTALDTEGWDAEGDTTFLPLRTAEPGTYVVGVSTLPRELDLAAADFNDYLAHDGVTDVLEQRERDGELDQDVRERYSKHVKAIYQVGEETSGGLDVILGYPAELLPLENPYRLGLGRDMAVRAMVDGTLVAGQLVLAGGEGPDGPFEERSTRTDGAGVARFTLDRPGLWYVKFIHMVKTDVEGVDYESKWATLTFEVR